MSLATTIAEYGQNYATCNKSRCRTIVVMTTIPIAEVGAGCSLSIRRLLLGAATISALPFILTTLMGVASAAPADNTIANDTTAVTVRAQPAIPREGPRLLFKRDLLENLENGLDKVHEMSEVVRIRGTAISKNPALKALSDVTDGFHKLSELAVAVRQDIDRVKNDPFVPLTSRMT